MSPGTPGQAFGIRRPKTGSRVKPLSSIEPSRAARTRARVNPSGILGETLQGPPVQPVFTR